ncbi:MAG: glycosyltransferase family 4 protein [Actinobacteria bacterium]|nr:glycosyltransferase family 4 protein [Actinomycetota bacterium]
MAAVFVLPTSTAGQRGPVAAYLSTAGWAAAAERVLGAAWIACPSGLVDPAEARRIGSRPAPTTPGGSGPARRLPLVPDPAKTLAKDVLRYRSARRFHVAPDGPWAGTHLDLVWQRHELFQTAGIDLARALHVPSVLFAPATAVWEAERWGTHRPGWGHLVERLGERPALTTADVVACGAPEVAEQAVRIGTDPERIVITPTGVDLDLFDPPPDDAARQAERDRLGLADRFVVGWVGSFRPFHSLDRAVEAVAGVPDVALLLVGDGPERPAVEARARELGVHVVCTGTVAHADLPRHLSAMDVGLVLGPADGAFHYSPLKLAEYLAAGLPVVAPDVGTVTARLTDGVDALLVDPADPAALGAAVRALRAEPALRRRLSEAGRAAVAAHWSWDEQVRRVVAALERLGLRRDR